MVIPVYNGEEGLVSLVDSLIPHLDQTGLNWEIFFVDDGSGDGSFPLIREMHRRDSRIRGCALAENRGQQNALYCGLVSSSGNYVITMDDDGQHPVDQIPLLIGKLEEGYDAVYSVNRDPCRPAVLRLGTAGTGLFFTLFCRKPRGVEIGSYRILRREIIESFPPAAGGFVYVSALLFASSPPPRVCSFRYQRRETGSGRQSRFSLGGRFKVFRKLFLYYGPLRRFMPLKGEPFRIGEKL